MKSKENVRML